MSNISMVTFWPLTLWPLADQETVSGPLPPGAEVCHSRWPGRCWSGQPCSYLIVLKKRDDIYLFYSCLHSIQFVTCNAKMREGLVIFVLCILGNDILYVRWTLWDQTHPEVLCDVLKKCCLSSHATEQTSNSSWRTAFGFCCTSRHPLRISFSIASDKRWVAGLGTI